MKELAIEALLDHKVPLKSILDLCPRFKEKVFKNWAEEINEKVKGLQGEAECHMAQAEEPPRTRDDNVAKIKMIIAMQEVQGVILDGGSGVNVITEDLAIKLGLKWEPIPFNIRMADNRTVVPKGLIKHAKVRVGGMDYLVNLVVITMQTPTPESYQVLLGRPWLKDAKVKHDWNRDRISLKKGKKKVYIEFGQNKTTRIDRLTPLHAETYNMAEGLEEDEEEYLLRQNPNLVPLFMVHLDEILQGKEPNSVKKKNKKNLAEQEDIELRARECGSADLENLQAWIKAQKDKEQEEDTRVKQDQLEEVNLGEEGEEQQVRVSAELEEQFKEQLVQLLKEYKDVFAWSYTDMEGIDPKFYQHKINLKEGAVPVKQQRYRMNPNYAKQVKEEIDRLLRVGFIYPSGKSHLDFAHCNCTKKEHEDKGVCRLPEA